MGYGLIDHDADPVMAVLAGKLQAKRRDSRRAILELSTAQPGHRPSAGGGAPRRSAAVRGAQRTPPAQSCWTWMPRTIRCMGISEGRFFHGYYDSYLPLHLLRPDRWPPLRRAHRCLGWRRGSGSIVRQLRRHWPHVRILLRAEPPRGVEVRSQRGRLCLARNPRLVAVLEAAQAAARPKAKGRPARRYKDFLWSTRESPRGSGRSGPATRPIPASW